MGAQFNSRMESMSEVIIAGLLQPAWVEHVPYIEPFEPFDIKIANDITLDPNIELAISRRVEPRIVI